MEEITLKSRKEFLSNVTPKEGFNFRYICNFDEEVKSIIDFLSRQLLHFHYHDENHFFFHTHKNVGNHGIMWVSNYDQIELPYTSEIITDNLELLEIITDLIKKLENIVGGKVVMSGLNIVSSGKSIPTHTDQNDGKQSFSPYYMILRRFHIPIFTNTKSFIRVGSEFNHMKSGECWEFNNNIEHEVWNNGGDDRLHLLFDVLPYNWL